MSQSPGPNCAPAPWARKKKIFKKRHGKASQKKKTELALRIQPLILQNSWSYSTQLIIKTLRTMQYLIFHSYKDEVAKKFKEARSDQYIKLPLFHYAWLHMLSRPSGQIRAKGPNIDKKDKNRRAVCRRVYILTRAHWINTNTISWIIINIYSRHLCLVNC